MDRDLERVSVGMPQSNVLGQINGVSSNLPGPCAICQGIISSDSDAGDPEASNFCGVCRFLLQQNLESPVLDTRRRRRISRVRRTRFSSSESIEDLFSQQFSHMINLARQNQPNFAENEYQSLDDDGTARLQQRSSSRTTPRGSRRWRRVLSDTESDGLDSLYGESESNISFSGYRPFPGESDTISYSAYGGDSDASVDGRSFLDTDIIAHPDGGSDLDSDTDIDPMHAGLNQWNMDYQEEEDEEDTEWEEADAEENTVETLGGGARLRSILSSDERSGPVNWHRRLHSPEFESAVRWRIGGRRLTFDRNVFANLEESETPPFVGNSGDYLDARGFEELLERLAVTDISRRGAPPAAVSYVNSLPRVVINEEEHVKQDDLACAICKDFLSVGTVVSQLPCCHLYHPSCILPWLSARNSCPLCRYELPTDDKDYEERKQNTVNGLEIREIEQQGTVDDSSSDMSTNSDDDDDDDNEADEVCELGDGSRTLPGELVNIDRASENSSRETPRGRWFFLAAAPIVSLVGIALVLWLGNPLTERRVPTGHSGFSEQGRQSSHSISSCLPNQRESRSRRWWSLF